MKETSSTASTVPVQVPAWLLLGPAAAAAAILGFGASGSLLVIAAVLAGSLALLGFAAIRLSVPVKLIFLLITVTFLQRLLGYFKLGEVRGLNAGNLLLLAAVGYWFLRGVSRGALYRPTPLDFWLGLTAVAIPLLSIAYTVSVRRVPGYSLMAQLAWYKQWVTPFVYLFLLCQCLETRKEVRRLFYLVLFLVGLAVLQGLPEALRITTLHVERARGIVGQANDYAGLLATTAPFPLLILFLLRGRPAVRVLALGLVGCLALCLLSTYSRAGYIGFGISLAGAAWVAYRGTRRLAVAGPLVLVGALCLVPFAVAPQLIESVQSRFETDTYKRAKRKSYSKLSELNQFSGNRLEIWKGALKMAEANPVFGVGFHAFEAELPKY
ncbi:MAG: O-antigen ligase family protein, partial [Planctomycetes bacterium]|nr:O-antigen ligase family protein [Planctomycetota bacterium]